MSESNDKKKDYLGEGPLLDLDPNNKAIIDTKSGDIKSLNSDIKKPVKKTLKDYLSAKTSEQENYYKIDKSDKEISVYGESIKYAASLSNSPNDSMYKSDFLSKDLKEKLVVKGKSKEDIGVLQNGNELLKDNNIVQDTSSVQTYLSRTLLKNRFNPENEYTKNFTDATFSIRKYKNYVKDGDLIKLNNSEDNTSINKNGMQITANNMNEIAEALMLRASGKFIANPETSSSESGPNNSPFGPGAAVMIPGLTQLLPGIKNDGSEFDINELIKYFEGDQAGLGELKNPGSNSRYNDSYGVLNNYFDRFSKMSVGSLALVTGIVVALFAALLVSTGISAIFSSIFSSDDEGKLEEFGIRKSKKKLSGFKYFKHIWSGIGEFFNPKNVFFNHGFYIIFCRALLRDSFNIARRFSPTSGTDTIEFADNIISTDSLDLLNRSKIITATNLFIFMADISDSESTKFASIPYRFNYPGKTNIYNNSAVLGISNLSSFTSKLNQRKNYEDSLNKNLDDGSIPFYIQDLRNDNIINFRATITDLSDSYSPQWSEESYFGRVDPVKIYKSTTRKLSVSFKIFSESAADHNNMWQKIDGLTSLVYPTLGEKRKNTLKSITGKNINYEIPYSQSFKAQPLVRIKIGDLIQNNFLTEGSLIDSDDLGLIMQYEIENGDSKDFNSDTDMKSLTAKEQKLVQNLKSFKFDSANLKNKGGKIEKDSKKLSVAKLKQLFDKKIVKIKTSNITAFIPIDTNKRDDENGPEKEIIADGKKIKFKPHENLNNHFFGTEMNSLDYNTIKSKPEYYPIITPFITEDKEPENLRFIKFDPNKENAGKKNNSNWKFEDYVKLEKVVGIYNVLENNDNITYEINSNYEKYYAIFSIDFENLLDSWDINLDYLEKKYYFDRIVNEKDRAISKRDCLNWLKSNVKRATILKIFIDIQDLEFNINEALENQGEVEEFFKNSSSSGAAAPEESGASTSNEESEKKIQIADFKSIEKNPIFRAAATTFGRGAPAYIDSLSYKIPENYTWNVAPGAQRKPFMIDVSMDLTIIHDFVPYSNITQTRIATNYTNKKKI